MAVSGAIFRTFIPLPLHSDCTPPSLTIFWKLLTTFPLKSVKPWTWQSESDSNTLCKGVITSWRLDTDSAASTKGRRKREQWQTDLLQSQSQTLHPNQPVGRLWAGLRGLSPSETHTQPWLRPSAAARRSRTSSPPQKNHRGLSAAHLCPTSSGATRKEMQN